MYVLDPGFQFSIHPLYPSVRKAPGWSVSPASMEGWLSTELPNYGANPFPLQVPLGAERWQLILVLSKAGASWGSTFGGPGRCSSVLTSGLALPSPEGSEGQTC